MILKYKSLAFSLVVIMSMLLGAVGIPVQTAQAAGTISLTSDTAYTENFDTLSSSDTSDVVPAGWYFSEAGTNANTTYGVSTGSSIAGDTYSYGTASAPERAFGELTTGTLSTMIGANFSNDSGVETLSLAISYTGEQWRLGALGRADQLDFQYSMDATSLTNGTWTDVNELDFTAPVTSGTVGLLDGNASGNRVAITHTITGLNIPNGSTFWIRWNSLNASDNDDGLGVDEFSLIPELANRAPTDIVLSDSEVAENQPVDTVVGALSTTDPDTADAFTYSLENGAGDTDNTSFTIVGNELHTAASFDYETQNSYSVRVRSTDQGNLYYEKVFAIGIVNMTETPSDTSVADFSEGNDGTCVVDSGIGDGALRLDVSSTLCVFESRILDAGESVNWDELNVTGTIPVGTSVSFETRTGNIPVQDSTWLDWEAVSGSITSLDGRYIQYRATLTSPSAGQTPVVEQVELTYTTKDHAVLNAPNGTLNSWDNKFNWTGVTGATHYVVEVYDAGNALILRKWYTTSTAGCDMDLECEVSPITLGNGNYTWRVAYMDAGRYGPWTGFTSFTLSAACYELTVNIDPPGTGTVATTAPVCGVNGYPAGAVVTLTASPANRFNNWSGDAGGTTSTVTVTMNGNKSVTGNFYGPAVVVSPSGAQTTWNNQFSWTGVSVAVSYELEVYNAGNVRILNQWFGASTNCTGLSCTASPSGTANLADGSYTWRVRDYNSNGYGAWTPQTSFSLSQPCYQLATNINPAGSGAITTSAQNCTGGYKPGTVVTLTASPVNRFNNWSGDASGTTSTVTVTMNGNKSVTGNFYGPAVVVSPSGAQTTWNNQFSWTGVSVAVSYELEVYNAGNVRILNQWFGASTNCTGLSCTASPSATKVLTDGSYTWRIRDYNSNGYGAWTPLVNFSVPCFVLTKDVNPAGSGTVSAPAQNCTGGYKPGTVVTLTASPVNRFNNWSGDASGTTSTVTVTMNGNKSVTGNFYGPAVVVSPSGAQTTWNNQFSWTGVSVAVSYELEVYNAGNVRILNQWFGASTNCTGLSCTASPSATKVLTDGSYTWRIRDYNSNGYGAWTPLVNFSVPCFVLTKNVSPAGSGVVNTPAQNCTGGYKPGTVVTLTASPVNRFNNWSGDASGTTSTVTVTMNGNKSVTGNFYGPAVVVSPSGAQTTWNNQFSWTGVSVAVSYELEVYNAGNVRILNQWFGASTNCTGLSCTASPSGTANLADGSYTWRVRDYNSNGYGAWTPLVSFNKTYSGALDTTFNYGTGLRGPNNFVYALAVQPDGKVILGGGFTGYDGNTAYPDGVIRLNTNGTIDTTFNTGGAGINGLSRTVYALAVDANGRILVGGNFNQYNGVSVPSGIIRLNSNGTLDTTFNPGGAGIGNGWETDTVFAIDLQPSNGMIVVGGDFTSYNGDAAAPDLVIRLNTDGSRDTTGFITGANTGVFNSLFPDCGRPIVYALKVQPADEKIVIGGHCFNSHSNDGLTLDTTASDNLQRLNTDGTLDTTFSYSSLSGFDDDVRALAIQPDGKIIFVGDFTGFNLDHNVPHGLVRVNTDGSRDTSFLYGSGTGVVNTASPGSEVIYTVAVQADGKILIGGLFDAFSSNGTVNDTSAPNNLLRLNANGTLDTSFNYGSTNGTNGTVRVLVINPSATPPYNSKIWIGGAMSSYNGDTNAPDGVERLDY